MQSRLSKGQLVSQQFKRNSESFFYRDILSIVCLWLNSLSHFH